MCIISVPQQNTTSQMQDCKADYKSRSLSRLLRMLEYLLSQLYSDSKPRRVAEIHGLKANSASGPALVFTVNKPCFVCICVHSLDSSERPAVRLKVASVTNVAQFVTVNVAAVNYTVFRYFPRCVSVGISMLNECVGNFISGSFYFNVCVFSQPGKLNVRCNIIVHSVFCQWQ